jgi:hypothetical protein
MEFVMTYGWGLLIILVMVTGLAYFGIIQPANITPDRCVVSTGFVCGQYQLNHQDAGEAEVIVEVHNIHPKTVWVLKDTFTFECDNCIEGYTYGNAAHCPRKFENPADFFTDPQQNYDQNGVDTPIGTDSSTLFACGLGPTRIAFASHDAKARVRFSFQYRKAGKSLIHQAEGEIYSMIQG